ncbi:hypothetical protein [Amycolatopsis minnesotensis]|uniref:ABC transporter permease n=1 Tax=Amycolatopsis minnesotensis TaxID=337894 RepID=A0ABN2QSE4_9PSEU
MTAVIRSECAKLRANPVALGIGALAALVLVGGSAAAVLFGHVEPGSVLAAVVPFEMMPMVALMVTEEYRTGTAWLSFVATPRRWKVLLAKGALAAPVAFAAAVVASLVATAGAAGLAVRCGLSGVLVAVLGLGVGAITRHGATAVALSLAWGAVLERLLSGLPEIGPVLAPFLPLANLRYFCTGDELGIAFHWPSGVGAVYVLVVAAALSGWGAWKTERTSP